jgi:hypothetical protein
MGAAENSSFFAPIRVYCYPGFLAWFATSRTTGVRMLALQKRIQDLFMSGYAEGLPETQPPRGPVPAEAILFFLAAGVAAHLAIPQLIRTRISSLRLPH